MADFADVYDSTRSEIVELVRGLSEEETSRSVPATPAWSIRDVIAHLAGDVDSCLRGEFPTEFFMAFGQDQAVASLDAWTAAHIATREGRTMDELLDEWEGLAEELLAKMRAGEDWAGGLSSIAEPVLVTDVGAHQQDINGALGIEGAQDSAAVKIGTAGYIRMIEMRLGTDGLGPLGFRAGEKAWTAGSGEPAGTVTVPSRWELFRALSGRRNPDQVRAYDWDGDPEPYLRYFYPYGVRQDPLVE